MNNPSKELYKQLKSGPAFLLLGQDYLKLDSGRDPFLSEVLRKYGEVGEDPSHYRQILEGKAQESPESALAWMQERCERFPSPNWLETVASFPWSGVYSSAIDTIGLKAFRSGWRELQPLYDAETLNPLDPRNRYRLHCTFLFGCVNQTEKTKRPPLNEDELDVRDSTAVVLARRLPELITPLGVLVIEGYAGEQDWFSPQKLAPVVNLLNPGQIHIFSVTKELREDRRISRLSQDGKLVLHTENLAIYLLSAQEAGYLQLGQPPEKEEHGRRILLENKSLTVPLTLWNQVSRSATILDDAALINPDHIGDDRLYSEFRNFLAESSNRPIWSGYARGFAFRRDFEDNLREIVIKKLRSNELQDEPIILCGQAGTGKSIALGGLAYSVRKESKYPVLFIERRSRQPLLSDLDAFCKWVEDCGASVTLVVWDGMVDQEQYYEFSRRLASRGRKVVLVGSSYGDAPEAHENFIQAPPALNRLPSKRGALDEISRFIKFIQRFAPSSGAASPIYSFENSIRKLNEKGGDRFLVALYSLLPQTRSQIRVALAKEAHYVEQEIPETIPSEPSKTSFAAAFLRARLITEEYLITPDVKAMDTEELTQIQKLLRLVMVPGRFELNIPLELLTRTISRGMMSDFVGLFNKVKTNIIEWYEYNDGKMEIGARHRLEAQEITRSLLGGAKAEVDYAKKLLLNVREKDNFNSDAEIAFAINFVRSMGPNGFDTTYFANYFQDISEILRRLREEQGIQNVSLMLQEANLLRETVRNISKKQTLDEEQCRELIILLDRAKEVLHQALNLLGIDSRTKGRRSRLLVELASVLGTEYILQSEHHIPHSFESLKEAQKIAFEAFALNSDNFYPIDVLSWTSEFVLREEPNLDPRLRAEIEANIYHAFTLAETEKLAPEQEARFQGHREEIGRLTGRNDISEDAFQALIALGSSAGYYLRAYDIVRGILSKNDLNNTEIERCREAVEYLQNHRQAINQDGRSLYLLLKVWWLSKTGKKLFYGERQTVPFKQEDWQIFLEIIEGLMATSEFYENPSLTYLKGLANFHLDRIQVALEIFNDLEHDEDTRGRRRIIRSYIASNPDSKPRTYTGEVAWRHDKPYEPGKIYVAELQRSQITFIPQQFGRPDIKPGESLGEFHLAFNFLGPIADPVTYYY